MPDKSDLWYLVFFLCFIKSMAPLVHTATARRHRGHTRTQARVGLPTQTAVSLGTACAARWVRHFVSVFPHVLQPRSDGGARAPVSRGPGLSVLSVACTARWVRHFVRVFWVYLFGDFCRLCTAFKGCRTPFSPMQPVDVALPRAFRSRETRTPALM